MELKHEKITQYIPAIFIAVVNGDIKSCKSSSSLLRSDLVCVHVQVLLTNVKSKHEERLIIDRLSVRVFFRLL